MLKVLFLFFTLIISLNSKEIMKLKYKRLIANDTSEYNNRGSTSIINNINGTKSLISFKRNSLGFRYIEFDKDFNEIKYEIRIPNYPNGTQAKSGLPKYVTNESNILFEIDSNYYISKDAGLTTKIVPSNELLRKYINNGEFKENKDYICFMKYELILLFDKEFNFIDSISLPDSLKDKKEDAFVFFESTFSIDNKILSYVSVFRKGAKTYKAYASVTYDINTKKWNLFKNTNGARALCMVDDTTFFGGTGWDRWHLLKYDKDSLLWVDVKASVIYIYNIIYDGERVYYMNPEHIGFSTDKGKTWDSIKVEDGHTDLSASYLYKDGKDLYMISSGEYYQFRKLENVSSVDEYTIPNQAQIQAKAIVTNGTPTQITISNVLGKTLTFTTLEEANNYLLEAKGLMLLKLDFTDKEPTYLKHYFE